MRRCPVTLFFLLAAISFGGRSADGASSDAPHLNGAAALRYQGSLDLDVKFSEFFAHDHSVMFWFMPQYPYGPAGPMIAENGTGTYMVGQGDFRWGNGGPDTCNNPGDPLLFIKIGNQYQQVLAKGLKPGAWAHLAIVRSGNTFTLFLNGDRVTPSLTYAGSEPIGNLRLGRRTDGVMHGVPTVADNYLPQFYGFVDEVAVFTRALTKEQIDATRKKGLTGKEQGLLAGFLFDFGTEFNAGLPQKLRRSFVENAPAFRAVVSDKREDAFDAKLLPLPKQSVVLKLPFEKSGAWHVVQGFDDRCVSHNGGHAAFSMDMSKVGVSDSTGQPLFLSTQGKLVEFEDSHPCGNSDSNYIVLSARSDFFLVYHHLNRHSVHNVLPWSPADPRPQDPGGSQPNLSSGEPFGEVDSTGLNTCSNSHMHLGVRTDDATGTSVQFPWGFSNYEASDDGGQTWYPVEFGIPKPGQQVRKP